MEEKLGLTFTSRDSDDDGVRDSDQEVAGLDAPAFTLAAHTKTLKYDENGAAAGCTVTANWGGSPVPAPGKVLFPQLHGKLAAPAWPQDGPTTDHSVPWGPLAAGGETTTKSSPSCTHITLAHQRLRGVLQPPPAAAAKRTMLLITGRRIGEETIKYTAAAHTFTFEPGVAVSTNFVTVAPAFTSPVGPETVTVMAQPVEFVVPDVTSDRSLPVLAGGPGAEPGVYTDEAEAAPPPAAPAPATPARDYTNKARKPVSHLKIAKLEHTINKDGALDAMQDPDLFRVRIRGLPKDTTASFLLRTEKADGGELDPPTKILMKAGLGNSPEYQSEPLLLVADAEDDTGSPGSVKEDEAEDDRTHRAELGGKIIVDSIDLKFSPSASKITLPLEDLTAGVPRDPVKKVTVTIIRLSDCGVTQATILEHVGRLKERFMQVGVSIEVPAIVELPVPAELGVNGSIVGNQNYDITPSEIFLAKNHGTPSDTKDIRVFYCKRAHAAGYDSIRGFARISGAGISGNIYMNGADTSLYTLSHEVGHILTKAGHYGTARRLGDYRPGELPHRVRHNLMTETTLPYSALNSTKRFYQLQENMIFPRKK